MKQVGSAMVASHPSGSLEWKSTDSSDARVVVIVVVVVVVVVLVLVSILVFVFVVLPSLFLFFLVLVLVVIAVLVAVVALFLLQYWHVGMLVDAAVLLRMMSYCHTYCCLVLQLNVKE